VDFPKGDSRKACRVEYEAFVLQSGRDTQFSSVYGNKSCFA